MTPNEFISKWKASELSERSAAQSHFNDLCRMLDEPTPTDADPRGEWYCFERGATKSTGADGWADVWKRGHFGWEYKGKRKDLNTAFAQLQQYALALENPPLLVVCDMDQFRVHTNWTNSVSEVHKFGLDDLRDPKTLQILKWVLSDPEKLRPGKTRQTLTEEAAGEFAKLAQRLRDRGHNSGKVAHFINRLVFCMFAEDVELLPNQMFKRMLEHARIRPQEFQALATDLFRAMRAGGRVGFEHVDWFNGGLFDDDDAFALDNDDIALTLRAADLDWAEIDPSIFGTLFERGLDPSKRSQLGAHYTDREKILQIVEPVITRPWLAEWEATKGEIATHMASMEEARARRPARQADARRVYAAARRAEEASLRAARATFQAFLERLRQFRVLDPACGSGNFLYLALLALKDLEHRANLEGEAMGLQRSAPAIGPECVLGIEINPYAAELARVTVWIGEIQWMRRNGFGVRRDPILRPLDTIENRDALLNADSVEADWPPTDVVIGNPPFLGNKAMLSTMGEADVVRLRRTFAGRLPGGVDLVTYWFEKAKALLAAKQLKRAGLVATQAIRRGANRTVLDRIAEVATIYDAWADEPWVVDGAAVRVSLICFGIDVGTALHLNGQPVSAIHSDLSGGGIDLTNVTQLSENAGVCFQGPVKVGAFDIPGAQAREWLLMPLNPNGRSNADVVRPWVNGRDLTGRPSDTWIIDFGEMTEADAALYQAPFEFVRTHIKPFRDKNADRQRREKWWRLGRSGSDLRGATANLRRVIATPRVAKHRFFVWIAPQVLPDSRVNVIARDDDVAFGVLQSRFHEAWSLRLGGWHGVGNDPQYTPSTGFETFPFPQGLTPDRPADGTNPHATRIAGAARRLHELRDGWLHPADLVRQIPEVALGFPDRIEPADEAAAAALRSRTLTILYNERPTWLVHAHAVLDAAVAAAYGWPAEISEDEAMAALLRLNREHSKRSEGASASREWPEALPAAE